MTRSRVSYSKELRDRVKKGAHLVTIDVLYPHGERVTLQGPASEKEAETVRRVLDKQWRTHGEGKP